MQQKSYPVLLIPVCIVVDLQVLYVVDLHEYRAGIIIELTGYLRQQTATMLSLLPKHVVVRVYVQIAMPYLLTVFRTRGRESATLSIHSLPKKRVIVSPHTPTFINEHSSTGTEP